MAEPIDRTVYVRSTHRRIRYETATDDPMAYDVTEKISDGPLQGDDIVDDLVELDDIRAELGLVNLNLARQVVNKLWRWAKMDTKVVSPKPGKRREYRIGHPKHH